tara:strand:- start:466 stop:1230 length:765 start_codon:yes stop_codon:yes gene_type:complete
MVNIDTVYQKVLALANKEQRGYITPQEFNLYADHAQKEIFEQYFYDLNQFNRVAGNQTIHSDMRDILEGKISAFEFWAVNPNTDLANDFGDINLETNFPDLYKLIEVRVNYNDGTGYHVAEEMTTKEFRKYENSPLTRRSTNRPTYIHYFNNYDRIKIHPFPPQNTYTSSSGVTSDDIRISYIKKPTKPNWGYVILNDKALYNADYSTNFELHVSEETELVYKILKLAGITLNKGEIIQTTQALENQKVQQEKQ